MSPNMTDWALPIVVCLSDWKVRNCDGFPAGLLQANRTKHTPWLACAALQVFIWAPGSGLAFMLILCQGTSHIDGPSWFASVLQQIHVTVARLCTTIAFLQILSNSSFPSHATIDTIYSEIGQYPYMKYTVLYTQFFLLCVYTTYVKIPLILIRYWFPH